MIELINVVLDFETYFDTDYSLKKIPTLRYIRDPKFLVHGAALKVGDAPSEWIPATHLTARLAELDWDQIRLIGHNLNFDNTILAEKYCHHAAQLVDTLGLCRALLPMDLDFDLDSIGPLLGLGGKIGGGDPLQRCKGLRELPAELADELGVYACGDADITRGIFDLLWPELPDLERDVLHIITRMSTVGTLVFNQAMAREAELEVIEDRERKLKIVGVTPEQLRSRDAFAELLRSRGVEPPMKISDRTHKETYAFSKGDPEFVKLRANPEVADLIEAKLVWASNNAISRIQNIQAITGAGPHESNTLPVQCNYNGAHTGRLSGGGKINMTNLNARGVGSKLRLAIEAPPDHVIVVADQSGIELRVNMAFSGQNDKLEMIRNGEDLYIQEASQQFNIHQDAVTNMQRQYGKIVQLGCGFQMGTDRFRTFCATGPLGMDPIYLSDADAYKTIQTYRANHPFVKASWDWLGYYAVPRMMDKTCSEARGPVLVEHEAIRLPSGLHLKYPNLTATEDGFTWGLNGYTHRIYGGILQENIVQALAACIIKEQMVGIDKELRTWLGGLARVVHQVYDEIIVVCHWRDAADVFAMMKAFMTKPISWMPQLPLAIEGGWDKRYSK